MVRKVQAVLIIVAACVLASGTAEATQFCGWIVESNQPDDVRQLDLWLQSDADTDFLIKIDGDGIADGSGKSNSPESATYSLHAGVAEKVWGFGSTLVPPGRIDEMVELHAKPADIFSDAPTPLLAKFVFRRTIPANEKKPPDTLAGKQCVTGP
jgi:hypothetical protein